jgi:hypothetical protein
MSNVDMVEGYENEINYYYYCKNFNDFMRSYNNVIEKENSRLLHRLFCLKDDHLKKCDIDNLIQDSLVYAKNHGAKLPSELDQYKSNLKEDLKIAGLKLDGTDSVLSITTESLLLLSNHFKGRDEKLLTSSDYRKCEAICLNKMRVPVVKSEKLQDM